jgi:hypothetical protein
MSINPQAGPVPSPVGPLYRAPGPARAHVRRLRRGGGTYRGIAAAAGLAPATFSDLDRGRQGRAVVSGLRRPAPVSRS